MISKKTPSGKGIRTAYQTVIGVVGTYFTGLLALPAVREYTGNFVNTQGIPALGVVLVSFGVGAGVVSFIQNRLEKK